VKTAIDYTELCLPLQLETNAAFDQFRAETGSRERFADFSAGGSDKRDRTLWPLL
jgi:hypothetical protein